MNFENGFLLGFSIALLPGARFTEAFQILFTSNIDMLCMCEPYLENQ